ncbi:hypothetical protein [Paramuribaculum intestinale]|uniref:hypothetical protein n=2 Tax=Paramuribaculum intestinale TaxID=2094151 RepID=UPI00272D0A46|nr:hypothetical protein [Paramuribaculum intestinale]
MSKLYDDVKKQGEQIDDLQKTVTNHTTRIETLETKAKATPPPQAVNQGPITVKLPDNIATNESIGKLLDEKLTATSTDGTLKKVMEQLPGSLSKGVVDLLSDNLGDKVKNALYEGIRREFADERKKLYDVVNDMRYKAQSIIWGQWWRATPHWAYTIFAVLLLAAGGFGYGFFYLLNENSKLKNVEWLYRYERLWWEGKQQEDLLRREKTFAVGTRHEQDSIKNHTRQLEKDQHIEETFLYFNPTEK